MFEWLRRTGREGSTSTHPPVSTVRHGPADEVARVGVRLLGTSPANKALLAALLANPPAWSNNLTPADLASGASTTTVPSAPGYALPGPLSAGMRAALASQIAFGQQFSKGDPTWDHPARG